MKIRNFIKELNNENNTEIVVNTALKIIENSIKEKGNIYYTSQDIVSKYLILNFENNENFALYIFMLTFPRSLSQVVEIATSWCASVCFSSASQTKNKPPELLPSMLDFISLCVTLLSRVFTRVVSPVSVSDSMHSRFVLLRRRFI